MSKRRDDRVKQSTICNACRATGKKPREVQRRVTGPDGRAVTVTETVDETCPTCNGYAEYPLI